jgi:hypothetical protein
MTSTSGTGFKTFWYTQPWQSDHICRLRLVAGGCPRPHAPHCRWFCKCVLRRRESKVFVDRCQNVSYPSFVLRGLFDVCSALPCTPFRSLPSPSTVYSQFLSYLPRTFKQDLFPEHRVVLLVPINAALRCQRWLRFRSQKGRRLQGERLGC